MEEVDAWWSLATGSSRIGQVKEGVFSLRFNLVLKFSPHAREAEGIAMSIARSMDVPAPRFISYGEYSPNMRSREGSILMTCIPGKMLQDVIESLSPEELHTVMQELSEILDCMRSYSNPWGTRVYGVDGKDVYGGRIPGRHIRACDDEHSFYATLLRATGARDDDQVGPAKLEKARNMPTLFPHNIVFTHGDLWDHNIMVDHGHISGIVNWEWAGWLPEHWEYTLILRWIGLQVPWTKQLASLPGYKYSKELEYDLALIAVSDSSFPI
ncbi:kinase-like domain-containing protein [Desarmillaria tabescens]|uniref:Kinase-like domain-containing protein n=1 Tax=Armillaria tabescens TaxID=1929756 RepID=A0AA39JAE9_ARMTA|nr:kinase-like domain-containing protein [Desarmillaria tabescens]KAK0438176.1 kinase-like domain-containing protein [Desarmillaria tabescens]